MYEKVKATEVPKRERKTESRFEKTPEWISMKADIEAGIGPEDALQVQLTPADMARYGIKNRLTVARFVAKHIKSAELPYSVSNFRRDGKEFIVVHGG